MKIARLLAMLGTIPLLVASATAQEESTTQHPRLSRNRSQTRRLPYPQLIVRFPKLPKAHR